MRKSLFVSISLMIYWLGMALVVQAQPARILDLDGKGVPEVEITVQGSCINLIGFPLDSVTKTTRTDAQGNFIWETPPLICIGGTQTRYDYKLKQEGLTFTRNEFSYVLYPTPPFFVTDNRLSTIYAMPLAMTRWVSVSAASYENAPLTANMISAGFGAGLAATTAVANTVPLPSLLGERIVYVRDASGNINTSRLLFVSPTQINFVLPSGLPSGAAAIILANRSGSVLQVHLAEIRRITPGMFSANGNGNGVAAAQTLRTSPTALPLYELVARYDAAQGRFVAVPIDLGTENETVYLVLYGTGFRLLEKLGDVSVNLGGLTGEVTFAGAQPTLDGLDQINVKLPRSLKGRGEIAVTLKVGIVEAAKSVLVNIK